MTPWKVILATMVIFACGVITGALVTKTVVIRTQQHPLATSTPGSRMAAGPVLQMQRAEFFKRLDKQLELSPDQREQIGKILKASQDRTQPIWDEIAPQMRAEVRKVREGIHGVLTPEQWQKFVEMMKAKRKPPAAPPTNGQPSPTLETTVSATNGS